MINGLFKPDKIINIGKILCARNGSLLAFAKSCGTKHMLYNKWRSNKTNTNWLAYHSHKRKLDNLIAKAKYSYYENEFSTCNTDLKKTSKTIKEIY